MNFTLHIWRQKNTQSDGSFVTYKISDIDSDTSFLEMLDQLNEKLIEKGEDCIVFDYDCREGICGTCSLVINGHPHGEKKATTTCQLYMRDYANQRELWIEPSAPEANSQLVKKDDADCAFDSATCIGCGACVAVCPNASASLFVAAKINHFERLPQGKIESKKRAERMINQMEEEGFGSCSNHRHCETVCPKEISVSNIAAMNNLL